MAEDMENNQLGLCCTECTMEAEPHSPPEAGQTPGQEPDPLLGKSKAHSEPNTPKPRAPLSHSSTQTTRRSCGHRHTCSLQSEGPWQEWAVLVSAPAHLLMFAFCLLFSRPMMSPQVLEMFCELPSWGHPKATLAGPLLIKAR